MPISDVFTINVTTQAAAVTQTGFGTPLILAPNAVFPERVRTYTDLAGVLVDFAITTPEYKAAAVMFAQSPRPPRIRMGRCANKPTQKYTITPTAVNLAKYAVKVNDVEVSFTADSSATVAEICTGLAAVIVAAGFVVASTGTTVTVTASAAGSWCSVQVGDPSLLSIAMDHVDPGVAADLAAINLESSDWYALHNPFNSKLMSLAAAGWVESNEKLFLLGTCDTECVTVVDGSATDVMKTAKTSAYARTSVWYHPDPSDFLDAAMLAKMLPKTPGSETWNGKAVNGVAPVALTATHTANLRAKRGNSYYAITSSNNWSFDGKVAGNEFIDIVRKRDQLKARLGERYIGVLASLDKLAFTDAGTAVLEAEMAAEFAQGERDGAFVPGSSTTSFDAVALSSGADKTARTYNGGKGATQLAGAIHGGTVNVTLSI